MREIEPPIDLEKTKTTVKKTVDELAGELDNSGLGNFLYEKITDNALGYGGSIGSIRFKFEDFTDRTIPNIAGVFSDFEYKNKTVYPIDTFHELLDTCQKIVLMIKERIIRKGCLYILNKPDDEFLDEKWKTNFNSNLANLFELGENTAYWLKILSERGGAVGKRTRKLLQRYGVNYPEKLPDDVQKLRNRVTDLYHQIEHTYQGSTKEF